MDQATGGQAATVHLRLRRRRPSGDGSGRDEVVETPIDVAGQELGLLLCDVWDRHWCQGAERRTAALAPRIAATAAAVRRCGGAVIHAPSETMAFYADYPQRQRALALPRVEPPPPLQLPDPPLPVDASDGGCDTGERPWFRAWSRQHEAIPIAAEDLISDRADEIYSFLHWRGIRYLLYAGVHTNMCILHRPFGIKAMTRWGVQCVLVRDLTDAMYNPAMPPYVSHEEGTELVVQYIERHWCPTVLSQELLAAAAG